MAIAATSNSNDVIAVTAQELAGATLDGQAGSDTLSLIGGGDFYLSRVIDGWGNTAAPARFINFETVRGSAALDRIYLNAEQLQGLSLVDGGAGDRNFLLLTGTTIDTRNVSFQNITNIVLYENNATVRVDDFSVAVLLSATTTKNDHLVLDGFALTDAEFRMFHEQGFDRVTDGSGRTSVDNPPVISGVSAAPREIRNDQPVSIDPLGSIVLKDDFGPIKQIKLEEYGLGATGRFEISNTDRVKVAGSGSAVILVDGTEVGTIVSSSFGLDVKFNGDATPEAISTILQATTFRMPGYMALGDDYSEVKFTAVDEGGHAASTLMTFYKIYDANGRGTMGGPLSDILIGGSGGDVIWGRGGDDVLYGKAGKDMLVGFEGKDTFVFDTKPKKASMDTISDFSVEHDSIWLDNKVFTKLGKKGSEAAPALLSKSFFTKGSKAKDKNDYIIYDNKKGVLYYDADGSGKGKAVEIATLSKKLAMTYKDFFVI
jgi:Ca2+-binding RTX toxin-like protein